MLGGHPDESGQSKVIAEWTRDSLLQATGLRVISLVFADDLLKMQTTP